MTLSQLENNDRFVEAVSPETLCRFVGMFFHEKLQKMVYVIEVVHLEMILRTSDNLKIEMR